VFKKEQNKATRRRDYIAKLRSASRRQSSEERGVGGEGWKRLRKKCCFYHSEKAQEKKATAG